MSVYSTTPPDTVVYIIRKQKKITEVPCLTYTEKIFRKTFFFNQSLSK